MLRINLSSKRAKLALRFFTYGVMTIATVVLTVLAVFYAMGYRFNQSLLTFEQGGLMQFRSLPAGARVLIDGKNKNLSTPARANLSAGTHTVEMQLNGYSQWRKIVELVPGQLLWLDYARLLPETITTTLVKDFTSMEGALTSPDRKWMLLQEKTNQPMLTLADLSDEAKPQFAQLSLPDEALTKKDGHIGKLALIEWDTGSRYVVIEHTLDGMQEFLRFDRSHPAETVNISRLFRLNVTKAHFAGNNPNVLYAKTDDVLRRLDIGQSSASAALITGLRQFSVHGGDTVAFTALRETTPGVTQQYIGVYLRDKEVIARTLPADLPLQIAYNEYAHHGYLAFTTGDSLVEVLRDPSTIKDAPVVAQFDLGKPVAWLGFNANGRMLAAGNQNNFTVYDLELDKISINTFEGAPVTRPLNWLDDYYVWSDAGDRLRIAEFDGANGREIAAVHSGLSLCLSPNGKRLFSFVKDRQGETVRMQVSKLIID